MAEHRVASIAIFFLFVLAGCADSSNVVLPGGAAEVARNAPAFHPMGPDFSSNRFIVYALPPQTMPDYFATGSDGNVWFTSDYFPFIGKITENGTVTEYQLPTSAEAENLTRGATGALWFSNLKPEIGRITTAGAITLFPLPPGVRIGGMSLGSDGRVWFTDAGNNSIGAMTTAGVATEYPLPTASAHPLSIAAGPDHNLWFTELTSARIGRITPTGFITEFPISSGITPVDIASARDGDLYVTTGYTYPPKLLQVTTSGVITGFNLPEFSDGTVIQGPDNRLYIGYSQDSQIGAFDLTSHIASPPITIPYGSTVAGLAVGQDGDIWFGGYNQPSYIGVFEETLPTVGVRLNGEMSYDDPNYGFELGYARGITTMTQTIGLPAAESVVFRNLDTVSHTASFLGDATQTSAPWPLSFSGGFTASPAGTAIGTPGFSTGTIASGSKSFVYETGMPGFYMIGCGYHYDSNQMRTVVVVR